MGKIFIRAIALPKKSAASTEYDTCSDKEENETANILKWILLYHARNK